MSDKPQRTSLPVAGKLQINIDDTTAQGVYSNFTAVGSNETEFVLDFTYVQPHQPRGKVRSRVILTPKHAKAFLRLLQQRVADYESRYGLIEVPVSRAGAGGGGSGLPN
ncbi:MAG: DUF3467 domain-containing protein [Myxococcota bacterium]|nr:DUF3467 domain-containing protein [Myxococcota bacterium]